MSTAAALLLALAAAAAAAAHPGDVAAKEADEVQLMRQRDIIRLLTHVYQPLMWEDMATISRDYKIQPDSYQVPHVADEYMRMERGGELLPMEMPVSVLDELHATHMKLFFDLLYHAKDYDVFYKTALYLRERVNRGLFLPAFFMAAMMRRDMQDVVLPPLYDVYPELFFPADAVHQIHYAKMKGMDRGSDKRFHAEANYTGFPMALTPEEKLSYFTEDVALNEFFALFFYRYPYFISAANYTMLNGEVRGDAFYHMLRQTFGRYMLERLANGLPEVDPIDYFYDSRVKTGYSPRLRLQNGIEIPPRPADVKPTDTDTMQRIWAAEYRLYEAVDTGYAVSERDGRVKYEEVDATNMLGNLVQSTADSLHPRYYGSMFRQLLSLFAKTSDVTHKYGVASSVLGKYETMARDPVYFQIVRRILNIFQQYRNYLPPYTRKEMEFPGLRIESADVDRLVTYFEDFYFDVDNMLREATVEEVEETNFSIRQPRLNHKPYTYRIKVSSEKPVKAVFRVFLGPRLDAYGNDMPLDVARQYFVEYDRFVYQVPAGETEVSRSSRDSAALRPDAAVGAELLAAVRRAMRGERPFRPAAQRRYGFPERLALPRGSRDGLPLRLYVIATPLDERTPAATAGDGDDVSRECYTALAYGRPVGFPFDRRIPHFYSFRVPNAYMRDVRVYHKTVDEINRPAA